MPEQRLFLHTRLAEGLRALLVELEARLALTRPIQVFLAGGMAVHLYTAQRVTTDVDAEFGARLLIPNDLAIEIQLEDGTPQVLYFDTNYNPSFALMHEDYLDDAVPVDFGLPNLRLHLLSPVDLAVSKLARFAANDREDILALVRAGLTDAAAIETRAIGALAGYVGHPAMLLANLREALVLAREAEKS